MEPITKARLQRYISLKKENENRKERLARMKSNAELPPMREADGSQHSGFSGDRMARAVEAYLEYQKQIEPLLAANQREMAAIEQSVAALADPLEREVLRLRYMDGEHCRLLSWREVAWALYNDDDDKFQSSAKRLHDRALMHLENSDEMIRNDLV